MEPNYYLAVVNSVELDGGELEPREIVEVFFSEEVWLFPQIPSAEMLRANDSLLIYESKPEGGAVLGHCILKTAPSGDVRYFVGQLNRLKALFPLHAAITDKVLWEIPKAFGDLIPRLAFLEEEKFAELYLDQGLRQLSKADFADLVSAGAKDPVVKGRTPAVMDCLEDRMTAASKQDYSAALETVKWLKNLLELELPQQEPGLTCLGEVLGRLPSLQAELSELRGLVKTKRQAIEALEDECQSKDKKIAEMTQKLVEKTQRERGYKEAINELTENLDRLQTENESLQKALEEAGAVKKALQRIFSLLRGKSAAAPEETGRGEDA